MGLKSANALAAFCAELADVQPSPGGGSAAAAAGAMAVSLLAMVCGVTASSKRHAEKAGMMRELRAEAMTLQSKLLENARLDAEAYDAVVLASRRRREDPGEESNRTYESALRYAAEVPMSTAEACAEVMALGVKVADSGTRSAHSDVGTALQLAEAGLRGALMNVQINLDLIQDPEYRKAFRTRAESVSDRGHRLLLEAGARLEPDRTS